MTVYPVKYIHGLTLTLWACYRYVRYKTDDEQFEAEINRARAIVGKPQITWCDEHHWQPVICSPGLANEPTCAQCV